MSNSFIPPRLCLFRTLFSSSETRKINVSTTGLKLEGFHQISTKLLFISQNCQLFNYAMLQNRIFCVCSRFLFNFQFLDPLRSSGTMNLFISDDSYEVICSLKVRRYAEFSTFYIKFNLFRQSEPWKDVELQNTHIDRFKLPRDVVQMKTPNTRPRFGPELLEWFRDATSVPYIHLLIELSPWTGDQVR